MSGYKGSGSPSKEQGSVSESTMAENGQGMMGGAQTVCGIDVVAISSKQKWTSLDSNRVAMSALRNEVLSNGLELYGDIVTPLEGSAVSTSLVTQFASTVAFDRQQTGTWDASTELSDRSGVDDSDPVLMQEVHNCESQVAILAQRLSPDTPTIVIDSEVAALSVEPELATTATPSIVIDLDGPSSEGTRSQNGSDGGHAISLALLLLPSEHQDGDDDDDDDDDDDERAKSTAADGQRWTVTPGGTKKRSKPGGKMKLVRSLAMCDESLAPSPTDDSQDMSGQGIDQLEKTGREATLKEKNGDRGQTEKQAKVPHILSRDSSQEYTDSTGIDLHEFLVNTLKNNPRDRMMLLKMEQELIEFLHDNKLHYKKFPPMTSYHRMLVHRVAAYFGMDHNVDQTGKAVVVNRTQSTRIPEQRFSEHFKEEGRMEESQKRFILKRDNASMDRDDFQHNRMRPLQQERRSKSFEERAEEYHRVRERIFAQNSTSPDTTQIEIRSKKDCGECMLNGRQGSVDAELMPSDLQSWSSTDSEVSCQRNIRPTVTKASSFGGISVLSRSDSNGGGTSSKPSICHLSKMGSDSSSSVSSTGSTTRPQYPAGQPPVANTHVNRPTSTGNNRSGGVHTPPNYYLLPLDLAGIPPGSILINPQTGQPLLNSDGSLAVYNPPAATSNSQPLRSPMAPPLPSQHQMPPHMQHPPSLRHPILQHPPSLQHQQQQQQPQQQQTILAQGIQAAQYPAVSYSQPHAMLPPMHTQHPYPLEDLGQHFGTMNLNRQTSAETSDPSTLYPMLPQASLQPGYLAASVPPSIGQHGMSHQGGYPGPSTSNHPQGYGHHPTQMAVYYCPTAQPPPSGQPFRSMTTLQYNSQRPTSTAFQPMATGQQLGYVAIPSAQGVIQGQQGGVASGVQGVVVPYPGISSYTAAPQGSTQTPTHPPQTFHPPVLLSGQAGPNTMPPSGVPQVYCSLGPAAAHNGLGSSMSYLPTPSLEQLNFPRTASPASSQPTHAQHYTVYGYLPGQRPPSPLIQPLRTVPPLPPSLPLGLTPGLPPPTAPSTTKSPPNALTIVPSMPGISPSGHPGMFMLQLSLPGGSHPTRPPSPPRRCQRRGYSLEQRPPRVCELPRSESLNQCSPRLVSPLASPSQSPSSTPHLNSHPGVLSFPLAPTAIPRPPTSSQADRSFPLLGASLQYVPSPSCPNSTVTLQQTTNRAGGRVKRPPRKAFSEDSSSVDPDFFRSSMLEVDLPAGVPRAEAEALLAKLGGKVRWVHAQLPNDSVSPNSTHPDGDTSPNPSDETTVATPGASVRDLRLVALFPTRQLAQVALSKLGLGPGTATNGFRLRPGGTRRCNEAFPTPERASSH